MQTENSTIDNENPTDVNENIQTLSDQLKKLAQTQEYNKDAINIFANSSLNNAGILNNPHNYKQLSSAPGYNSLTDNVIKLTTNTNDVSNIILNANNQLPIIQSTIPQTQTFISTPQPFVMTQPTPQNVVIPGNTILRITP